MHTCNDVLANSINTAVSSKLPVLFYIPGGGYRSLPTTNLNFDDFINESGGRVMVVQISYRVGALGFLAGSKVAEGGDRNVGLLDQRRVSHNPLSSGIEGALTGSV